VHTVFGGGQLRERGAYSVWLGAAEGERCIQCLVGGS